MLHGKLATKMNVLQVKLLTKSVKVDEQKLATNNNCALIGKSVDEFTETSTIHGLRHIFNRKADKKERICWTIGILIALTMLIQTSSFLLARYHRHQFKTVVQSTNYPVHKIAFPEITICNRNRLNWARLQEVKDIYLAREHHNTTLDQYFTQILALYDNFTFGEFERFGAIEKYALEALSYINFTVVAWHMSWRCDELLSDCVWKYGAVNCCDTFMPRRSQLGHCLAFNSVESSRGSLKQTTDAHWPWRVSRGGPGAGLSVKVLIGEQQHAPHSRCNSKGITLMAVEPTVWYYIPMDIAANTSTQLVLSAFINRYDAQTRQVPSNVRECVFKNERNSRDFKTLFGHTYRFENCQSECQQEHLLRYCNCTMDIFFPPAGYRICKLVDMPCLAKHSHLLRYFEHPGQLAYVSTKHRGIVCSCFQSCDSLRYLIKVISNTNIYKHYRSARNKSIIDLNIYFLSEYIIAYKTVMVYRWVDLLVSIGGTATLFLGSSLISIVELIYFICIKASRKPKLRLRPSKAQLSLVKLKEHRLTYKRQMRNE